MDVKVSADKHTKETFGLMEHVEIDKVSEVMRTINSNKQFKAIMENDTLVIKQLLRD